MYPHVTTVERVRVSRGVEFLDATIPDWRKHVDPERLNMDSSTECVLGQINVQLKIAPTEVPTAYTVDGLWKFLTGLDFLAFDSSSASALGFFEYDSPWLEVLDQRAGNGEQV